MTDHTLKSFANIHDDYAFFEAHVTETEATLDAWLPLVAPFLGKALRALDFGSGSGSFTSAFLGKANFEARHLDLTLVEPDPGFRKAAVTALSAFCVNPVAAWPLLDREVPPEKRFDLIFSHHVLYYVPDLETTLRRLCNSLRPGGRMLIVHGGRGNGMNQVVWAAFAQLGLPRPPYHYSEDSQAVLEQLGARMSVRTVRSILDIPNDETSRWSILRFLLSQHLARLPEELALKLFDPYVDGDRIRLVSDDELFVIESPEGTS